MSSELVSQLQRALLEESYKHYQTYTPTNSRSYGCEVIGCPNPAYAKKLCNAHYIRKRAGVDLSLPLVCRNRSGLCRDCGENTSHKGGWNLCPRCYKNKRRAIIKNTLVKFFGGVCKRCTQTFPPCVFDFHHTKDKSAGVSFLLEAASLIKIAEEALKCELLCANCHRLETYV